MSRGEELRMSEATTTEPADEARSVALLERLVESATQAMELAGVHIGLKLGLYRALADQPATSSALAEQLGLDERYVREWLEHQAVAERRDGRQLEHLRVDLGAQIEDDAQHRRACCPPGRDSGCRSLRVWIFTCGAA